MTAALLKTNGSKPIASDWLQAPVRQFFTGFNWDDHSLEVQEIKRSVAQPNSAPLSLKLSVHQFFSMLPWEGHSVASAPELPAPKAEPNDRFTLEDFSDLF